MKKIIIIFIGVLVISITYLSLKKTGNDWLTAEQYSKAMHINEPVGFDFIKCTKVKLTDKETTQALIKLNLKTIIETSNIGSYQANCHTKWWDIEFPKEATLYKISKSTKIRELATIKNGYIYYIYELR